MAVLENTEVSNISQWPSLPPSQVAFQGKDQRRAVALHTALADLDKTKVSNIIDPLFLQIFF